MVRILLQRFLPEILGFPHLPKIQIAKCPVVQTVRRIRRGPLRNLGIFLTGQLLINGCQFPLHFFKCPRSLFQTADEKFPECGRHRHFRVVKIFRAMLFCLRSGLPFTSAQIHFQDCQGPCVDIHPLFRIRAFRLLSGTIRDRIPGGTTVSFQRGARFGQAEVRDLRLPRTGEQQISRLHILMDQIVLIGIAKPPKRLDRKAKKPLLLLIVGTFI